MTANIKLETISAVTAGLQKSQTSFDKIIANIEAKEAAMLRRLDIRQKAIEKRARQMFEFDSIKQYIFWAGCISNLAMLILLLFGTSIHRCC
jgi:hypothetical protein